MDIQSEKRKIVAALEQHEEEWLIIAIKKLLGLDVADEFSDAHKMIVEERVETYKSDPSNVISIDELRTQLKAEGRL